MWTFQWKSKLNSSIRFGKCLKTLDFENWFWIILKACWMENIWYMLAEKKSGCKTDFDWTTNEMRKSTNYSAWWFKRKSRMMQIQCGLEKLKSGLKFWMEKKGIKLWGSNDSRQKFTYVDNYIGTCRQLFWT